MENRFLGESENKVDGKGRVSIPVKFRRVLQACDPNYVPGGQPRLYIAYGNPRVDYLECLSGEAYDKIDRIIQSLPEGSPLQELLSKFYYQKCDMILLDDSGRLVLPQAARDKINLGDMAIFQAKGKKFHIVRPEATANDDADTEALMENVAPGLTSFNPLALADVAVSAPDA